LSVGDFFFQQKCAAAMRRIKAAGVSILFVSHDTGAVQELADEVVLLEHGRITVSGDSNYVITHYHALDHGSKGAAPSLDRSRKAQPPSLDATTRHWLEKIRAADILGSRSSVGELGARILALRLIDACGRPASKVPSGGRLRIEAVIEARHDIAHANFGLLIADEQNRCIWSAASSNQNLWFGFMQDGDIAIASVEVTLDLPPGHYQINVQTGEVDPHDASFSVWNDARIHCAAIDVIASEHCNNRSGLGFLPMEISAL
jgi:lipopolysaccharide transport system ATP-binding protein